jgi:hypothetical protein
MPLGNSLEGHRHTLQSVPDVVVENSQALPEHTSRLKNDPKIRPSHRHILHFSATEMDVLTYNLAEGLTVQPCKWKTVNRLSRPCPDF